LTKYNKRNWIFD